MHVRDRNERCIPNVPRVRRPDPACYVSAWSWSRDALAGRQVTGLVERRAARLVGRRVSGRVGRRETRGVVNAWTRRQASAAQAASLWLPWQSSAMVPFTMEAEKDGHPFDTGRIRGLHTASPSQGIEHGPPGPTIGGMSRHSHSSLHRGACGCLGRPPWQRLCGLYSVTCLRGNPFPRRE